MEIVTFTVYRLLERKGCEVEVEDPDNEEEVQAAIESVISQKDTDFDVIEEYVLVDGKRLEIL